MDAKHYVDVDEVEGLNITGTQFPTGACQPQLDLDLYALFSIGLDIGFPC